jgi:hypothetical protein
MIGVRKALWGIKTYSSCQKFSLQVLCYLQYLTTMPIQLGSREEDGREL